MSCLNKKQEEEIQSKLISDQNILSKDYRKKKKDYEELSVEHSKVNEYITNKWEVYQTLKTKTKIRKKKSHFQIFKDKIWCQFYDLGFDILNTDNTLHIPFCTETNSTKELDIIAIKEETIFIIECISSEEIKKAPSYKEKFNYLKFIINGITNSLKQIFDRNIKVKYIFATNNLKLDTTNEDIATLKNAKVFYYNENTYDYINNLIKNYKKAAIYQFLGLVFKNQKINDKTIEIPAIEGRMGMKKYYMFSIEPATLLKLGFILHRTKANVEEMPTYQRLLQPKRLSGIKKFIEEGGYFPNSLIVNFNETKKLIFEPASQSTNSSSKIGILKIPNEYAIAYIIDGQHRLYGYANSKFKETNTVPVVGLYGLDSIEQLKIFMDINQNQKAVSTSLRGVLEGDLLWEHKHAMYRLKALKSSIAKQLSTNGGPLTNKIIIGEDKAQLSLQPFLDGLHKSGLLPIAQGDIYKQETTLYCLYDTTNKEHEKEMNNSKEKITSLLNLCYSHIEENYPDIFNNEQLFIVSNRGTIPFLSIIGNLNTFLSKKGLLNKESTSLKRFNEMSKYLDALMQGILNLAEKDKKDYLVIQGNKTQTTWLRLFQSIINNVYVEYSPIELKDWKERQNNELQDKAHKYVEQIERFMKKTIIKNLKELYSNDWELEIGSIQRKCMDRAQSQKEKEYKETGEYKDHHWTEMFEINDYKEIIKKYWGKTHDKKDFKTFEKLFSIDIGIGFKNKDDKTKWISKLSTFRNQLAHRGSKDKGLNENEVYLLELIHTKLYS